jgi:hypothetical protein
MWRRAPDCGLYSALSQSWVGEGIPDHYVSLFSDHHRSIALFFDMGFGRYVVDAYREVPDPVTAAPAGCRVIEADGGSLGDVMVLSGLSREFYRRAPLFLVREAESEDQIRSLLSADDGAMFLAAVAEKRVGFMNVWTSKGPT